MLPKISFIIFSILLLINCLTTEVAFCQSDNTQAIRKSSKNNFIKAKQKYLEGEKKTSEKILKQIITNDPSFAEAYLLLGNINIDNGDTLSAMRNYEQLINYDSTHFPGTFLVLSKLYFERMLFPQVDLTIKKFNNQHFTDSVLVNKVRLISESSQISGYYRKNPVPFNPVNLGKNINTDGNEYINALSSDGELLIFTRKAGTSRATEDFYFSKRTEGAWQMAELYGNVINSEGNEGSLSLSPDGQILFFAGCNREDGYGSCDIYYSIKAGDQWGETMNAGAVVNSGSWDSQPCMAADGRTLYFVSNRPGGEGKSDIWKSWYDQDKGWQPPVNLGKQINTPEDEFSPFIHPDRKTLYFSSKGHPGIGGFDFYRSELQNNGMFGKPINLGFPINSVKDEISMIVDITGEHAFYSTDNLKGEGGQDIYRFQLYEAARPNPVAFVKGKTYNAKTQIPVSAHFEIRELSVSKTLIESESNPENGEFLICIPIEGKYVLNASAEGYLFYSEHFSLKDSISHRQSSTRNVPLYPIEIGESTILNNIFFDIDKSELKPESVTELEFLVGFLEKFPTVSVEIGGHTDNTGNEAHNLLLSDQRAESVYNFLIIKGVNSQRLTFKGYGSSNPVSTNETPAGRAANRRTEFKITGK